MVNIKDVKLGDVIIYSYDNTDPRYGVVIFIGAKNIHGDDDAIWVYAIMDVRTAREAILKYYEATEFQLYSCGVRGGDCSWSEARNYREVVAHLTPTPAHLLALKNYWQPYTEE